MGIEINFKGNSDDSGEYRVSVGGFPPVLVGKGGQGRANALGLLAYLGLYEETKKKWAESLESMEELCDGEAILKAHINNKVVQYQAWIDNAKIYEGTNIDELTDLVRQTAMPNTGLREPGF